MKLRSILIVVMALSMAQPVFAAGKGKGAAHAGKGGKFTLKLDPIENKTLESSDKLPSWTKEDIKAFCEGRYRTIQQDKSQCEKAHKNDIGHKMTPADVQELQSFKKSGAIASRAAKRGAGHARKGKKGASARARRNSQKGGANP